MADPRARTRDAIAAGWVLSIAGALALCPTGARYTHHAALLLLLASVLLVGAHLATWDGWAGLHDRADRWMGGER